MVGISDHPEKMSKKSLHRRNDSGELDVFEAAKYFSGANDIYPNTSTFRQKDMQNCKAGGRFSLDMPIRKAISSQTVEMEKTNKEKKHKQPSSPGGRLAHFLNALFSQTSLKKKKSKGSSAKSVKDDDESPGWRRKRRSSVSNIQLQSTNTIQTSSSGFRTPPAYIAQTPKSSHKDFRCYSDHREISPFSFKHYGNSNPFAKPIGVIKGEKFKFIDEYNTKDKNGKERFIETEGADRYSSEDKELRKFSEADDGADSDSSSDLFDLPNCDLDFYSSGLPVYESTNIESLKKIAPISRGSR